MKRRWKCSLGGLALLLASIASAGELTPATKSEIDGLLQALGTSTCEFYRNGSWYKPDAARAHLQRKYEYFVKKDKIGSAEEFIERAGTSSSMTGEAYQVRCPGQATEPSATWLGDQLARLRKKTDPEAHPTK